MTGLLRPGRNALGALLSDGWWRGLGGGSSRLTNAYGATTALLMELSVELSTGKRLLFRTDESWRSTPSHIVAADLIAGEVHDLRRRVADWCEPGADRAGWDPVLVVDHPKGCLVTATGPEIRRIEELPAQAVTELAQGMHVVDFGQNSNGWVRLTDLGPSGCTLRIVHGEALDAAGDVTQSNVLEAGGPDPFQTDVVTSAGDGSAFEPRHSTKGFRFVRVEGHPGPLDRTAISSVVVHSDLRPIGGFSCSDDRLNRLHDAAVWSFRGNACGIPTDCPQRERAGWSGDWQVFVATAAYLYDVGDFSRRWLADLVASQREDGAVLNIVPDAHDFSLPEHARWKWAQGAAGWGDAACHVPWELYQAYGQPDDLATHVDAMRRWVDYASRRAAEGRHASRVQAHPQPRAHERFLWDSGFHFGEWCEPDAPANLLEHIIAQDHGATATAFLHRSARELAASLEVVGDQQGAGTYAQLADDVRQAWCTEFLVDGAVLPRTQANLVRALAFGLVPDDLRPRVADDLVDLVREAGTHLGTGFLATPFLLPVLADEGRLDVAYQLLLQDTAPSWLYMIEQGATTIWEDWGGAASLNHYSKGAVVSFLHHYVAGLQRLAPGYRRIRVRPRPGGGLTSAHTFHDSSFGRIEVAWTLDEDEGLLTVEIPEGVDAEIVLPDGRSEAVGPGRHERTWTSLVPLF